MLIVALLLFSCEAEESEDVNQDRIFTDYNLFYDQNEDITYARVTFHFGDLSGTKLKLSGDSSITFNGQSLTYDELLAYYELQIPGLVTSGTYSFKDINGETFENAISALIPLAFPDGMNTQIDRSQSYQISWAGESISDQQESVVATVVPSNLGQTAVFTQNNLDATSIILEANRLSAIDAQDGAMVLERFINDDNINAPSAGGRILYQYRTTNLSVTLN